MWPLISVLQPKNQYFQLKNAAVQLRELCSDDEEDIIASVILPSIKHKLNIKAKPFKPNYDRIHHHQRHVKINMSIMKFYEILDF